MARIAVISAMSGAPWGGSEELWAAMVRAALATGHPVHVSTHDWGTDPEPLGRLSASGADVVPRRQLRRSRPWRYLRPLGRRVLGDVASFRPDVICLSNGGSYDLVWDDALFADMRQFLSGSGCPLVLVCQHNTDWDTLDESHRERARWLYERAARICFVAEGNRRAAERHLALDLSRASIVRNPIGVPGEPLPWPGGDVARIACVARLHAKFKGQDLLIDVLSSEKWRDRPWRLELWGAGPDDRYLRQLVHATRLENRVALCGHGADVAAVWRENQLLVLPSRSEGTPLALVEAMACGRPAIATDVGGVGELLSTGGGILVPGWSRALLADALEHAWGRRQEWEDWGREAATVAHAFIDADPGGRLLQIVLDAGR